jgi:hypothetical protein
LATTFTAFEPAWKAVAGITGPVTKQVLPIPNALWRTGDFLTNEIDGTITFPVPIGVMIATAGPSLGTTPSVFQIVTSASSITQGVVTVTASVSAGAPAQTYYCVVAYANGTTIAATSISLPSIGFIINVPAGLLPVVSVSATGQPAASGNFLVYLSTLPGLYWFQGGAATGATVTPTSPLTNRTGANKATAGITTGILGMADSDSDASFFGGVGGSSATGKRSLFGATQSIAPGWTLDTLQLPVTKGSPGVFEINLAQQWNGQLYAAVGLNIDAATGYFVADQTQAACAVISDKPFGPGLGDIQDTLARVFITFNASALSA